MRIFVNDVAVRDGFQIEKQLIPTATKIAMVDALSATGLAKIEVASYVNPKLVPNMADGDEVLAGITRKPGVLHTAIALNLKGVERAAASPHRADEINVVMSASETHNRANANRTHAQSLADFAEVLKFTKPVGMRVNGTLSTTFGCPFEGRVSEDAVLKFVGHYLELGFDGVTLADTTGMANPRQVAALASRVVKAFPKAEITLHFHNTRGMGLANVMAGIDAGITMFDGSVAGLGGCPFAPGATGNICTEDLVNMLQDQGFDTGIDLDRLIACAKQINDIVGHDVPGQVMKAGKTLDLRPIPARLTQEDFAKQ
jgi:hydroxymethylglutaryl-CoA lyase